MSRIGEVGADHAAGAGRRPPPWKSGATELGIDALHHLVYVTATGVAYAALED